MPAAAPDLAALTRVMLGIPVQTGARARVVEAPEIELDHEEQPDDRRSSNVLAELSFLDD